MEIEDIGNASKHDVWQTVAFNIATVGLLTMKWFFDGEPPEKRAPIQSIIANGITAFGDSIAF